MKTLVKGFLVISDAVLSEFKWYRKSRKCTWYLVTRDKYGNGNSSGATTNWENKKPTEDNRIGTFCKIVYTEEIS